MVPPVQSTRTDADGRSSGNGVDGSKRGSCTGVRREDTPTAEVDVRDAPELVPATDTGPDTKPLLAHGPEDFGGVRVRFHGPRLTGGWREQRLPQLVWTPQFDEGRQVALLATGPGVSAALVSPKDLRVAAKMLGAQELLVWVPRVDHVQVADAWAADRLERLETAASWGEALPGVPLGAQPFIVKNGLIVGILDNRTARYLRGEVEVWAATPVEATGQDRQHAGAAADLLLFGIGFVGTTLALMLGWGL